MLWFLGEAPLFTPEFVQYYTVNPASHQGFFHCEAMLDSNPNRCLSGLNHYQYVMPCRFEF